MKVLKEVLIKIQKELKGAGVEAMQVVGISAEV